MKCTCDFFFIFFLGQACGFVLLVVVLLLLILQKHKETVPTCDETEFAEERSSELDHKLSKTLTTNQIASLMCRPRSGQQETFDLWPLTLGWRCVLKLSTVIQLVTPLTLNCWNANNLLTLKSIKSCVVYRHPELNQDTQCSADISHCVSLVVTLTRNCGIERWNKYSWCFPLMDMSRQDFAKPWKGLLSVSTTERKWN